MAQDAPTDASRELASSLASVTSSPVSTYVTAVYQDLLGRTPDAAGLQAWTTMLSAGTPRVTVANAITYSDEYRGRLISESYQAYLGRGPDPTGHRNWIDAMRYGLTIQQMEAGFLASDEYYAKAGGSNARWVERLYAHVLGRAAGTAEVSGWSAALARGSGGRYEVAMGFLLSTEHLTTVVDSHYQHLLGRGIDPTGARGWVSAIQAGDRVEAIIGGIVASDEYVVRNVGTTAIQPATPTPSPTPTPDPASGAVPGASNTGVPAGTVLRASGSLTITQANTVIDGLDISGSVTVQASGVVIKNSRIRGTGSYGVYARSGRVSIYDSEISGFENGIGFDNWSAYRVDIYGTTGDGVKLGSNVTLRDSWIHDLAPSPDAHADGGQVQSGVRNLVVSNNVIDLSTTARANAALFIAPDLGPSTDGPITITGNWLNGGNYTLFCVDGNWGQYYIGNISITNNRFGRSAQYGPAHVNVPITQSGNVWADTGAALDL